MSVKKETHIVRKIIQWIKLNGGDAYHVNGSSVQRAGEPDIDGYVYGHHLKVEVKTPESIDNVSDIQKFRLEKYKKAGYTTGVVSSLEEFKKLVIPTPE